ncbi:hypothetical protein TSMEX_008285 [Taenia solium]|eukprot:TsM_001075500 transcript=TsM_001075500 gene=TsM_001075500
MYVYTLRRREAVDTFLKLKTTTTNYCKMEEDVDFDGQFHEDGDAEEKPHRARPLCDSSTLQMSKTKERDEGPLEWTINTVHFCFFNWEHNYVH